MEAMRLRFACALTLVAGCGSSPAMQPDPHQGGSIELDRCGYAVTTRDGASRPIMGTNMLGPDPTPKLLHVDVAHDPSKDMAILWRTNDEQTLATTVQFGENGQLDQSQDGLTFVYDLESPLASGATSVRMHETHLCGLKADTEYSYRVGGKAGSQESWSPVYTFRTAPDRAQSPNAQLVVLVIGDTRGGYATWGQMLDTAFKQSPPDLILFSGDMTTLGPIQDDWDQWFQSAEAHLPQAPLVVAHGNHEVSSINFFSQFAMPADEQNFGFDFGPIHLSVANDTPTVANDLSGSIAQMLDANIKAGMGAPWSLVMHHKAEFTAAMGPHPMDQMPVRAAFEPLIDAGLVDLVLNGHDHDYERSKPLRAGQVTVGGTVFVVVGSAGADLYPNGSGFWTQKSEMTNSFAILRVRKGDLKFDAYRADGSPLDSFELMKP